MATKFEILKSLPSTGPMYVSVSEENTFYSDFSEGFVVRFYKKDGSEWVANIQRGLTNFDTVIELTESSNIIVIAGGQAYIINPENTKPISFFGSQYKYSISNTEGQCVLSDYTGLTIIEPDGKYWHSERISIDGIEDLRIEDDIVYGVVYMPIDDADEWLDFSYNITTKIMTGGIGPFTATESQLSNITIKTTTGAVGKRENKPWWKFW
ncbi:hypothetical protein GR160_00555 [Flavobacterium sp. Sd200]|uniref:hypothetical protein n=1 Tax=Flavobacterium sp. Sd200 TaxID=2692211 RepID=UPI00136987BF|nr:hypothetical protein [Flavobacterium sp. Sd200]MXN89704.1 hypothetical protein [Flavobacterium sp. Sd200]